MENFSVNPIGKININEEGMFLEIEKKYIPALQGLEGFSHLNIIWWFSDFDNEQMRSVLQMPKPYKTAPGAMGVFSTRSPVRPNPLALTVVKIIQSDFNKGIIQISYIDANNGTPVLDIKPYTPNCDRVEFPDVPAWCEHWPKSAEDAVGFDWSNELNL